MTALERVMRDCIQRRLDPATTAMRLECAADVAAIVGEQQPVEAVVWHRYISGVAVQVVAS